MRAKRSLCLFMAVMLPISLLCLHMWSKTEKVVAVWNREAPEDVLNSGLLHPLKKYAGISLKWNNEVLRLLPKNNCRCEVEATMNFPFRQELLGKPYAVNFTADMEPSVLELYKRRELEHKTFKMRSFSPADKIIIAEANSPLQYPVQGVEVRPLNTILIPGLSLLDLKKKNYYEVSLSCIMGTFNIAAEVDSVTTKGAGEKQISLSSPLLDNLNRQLQLISYTNTVFHPNTVDTDI